MKKVLVVGMTENPGGLESVIKNYYDHVDSNVIQFDFLCNTYEKVAYEDEFSQLGSIFYHIFPRSKNPIKFRTELHAFFKEHAKSYDAIWVNLNTLTNIDYLKLAKKYGIKQRIIHSHNSEHQDNKIRIFLHHLNKKKIASYATDFWACEAAAADWFFNEEIVNQAKIIPNAIKVERYLFNDQVRKEIRDNLGWEDNFIVGHVGRFHEQKNHPFVVNVFNEFYLKNPDARLVLIGGGADEQMIRHQVTELGLDDVVYFAGKQSNIQDWLSAFDVFLFPSLYEGLSIALLEAQANGVPILTNEKVIPDALQINSNMTGLSLNQPLKEWAKVLEEIKSGDVTRDHSDMVKRFGDVGFNISVEAGKLESYFMKGN